MDLKHIKAEDWRTLEIKHPDAYAFLRRQSLLNEEASLRNELANFHLLRPRREWIEERLADFDRLRAAFSSLEERQADAS